MSAVATIPFGALRARVPRPPQPRLIGDPLYTANAINNSLGFEVQVRAYLYKDTPGYLPDTYPIPVVPLLHTQIHEHITRNACLLDMSRWHSPRPACETAHCWAGWVVHLAGSQGYALERSTICSAAARLIMLASCDYLPLDTVPDFHSANAIAHMAIERYAALECHNDVTLLEDVWPRLAVVGV